MSRETVYSYLSFLENTYFIFLVRPFSRNIDGEVRGARKVYFCDTGLLNYLEKIPEGVILENSVFLNLKKYGLLNYYERYRGIELDFILNKKIALEIKTRADISDLRRLKRIANALSLKEYYLISKEYTELKNLILAYDI